MTKFNRDLLSQREAELLNLALQGLTDQQIASSLKISLGTVNTYWVRVRGKLGHYSRAELIAGILNEERAAEVQKLKQRAQELESAVRDRDHEELISSKAGLYWSILEAVPEPLFATDGEFRIVYANRRCEDFFGYSLFELMEADLDLLFTDSHRVREAVSHLNSGLGVAPSEVGTRWVLYARRQNRQLTRIILQYASVTTSSGQITTYVIRSFAQDLQSRVTYATSAVEAFSRR